MKERKREEREGESRWRTGEIERERKRDGDEETYEIKVTTPSSFPGGCAKKARVEDEKKV